MSEISRTSENNRLAYTNNDNRLNVSNGNNQTGGADETGGADRKSYLVNYIQQIKNDLENGDVHGGTLAQKKEWLQQALDMLHGEFPESSGWDPTAESAPVGFQANVHPTSTNHSDTEKHFYYRTGSSTKVILDRGDPNDARPTTAEFWTTDNGIYLPDNASDVTYAYDNSNPKDPTLTVEVHFPDGAVKKMIYHNVDRAGFKLKIEAANPDAVKQNLTQLTGDAAKKVTVTQHKNEADGSSGSERVGDKPTGTEDGADLYDTRKDVNISPIQDGTGQRTIVRAGGNVNITANSNSEYYKVEYKDGKYLVHVFANEDDAKNGVEKEVIEVDAKLAKKLNFDVDSSRITFSPPLSSAVDGDNKPIDGPLNPKADGASKISIISDGAVAAPGDTSPADTSGDTVTYDPTKPVTITNNPTSTTPNHVISSAQAKIVVSPSDRVTIEKTTDNPPQYKVTVTSSNGTPQTYTVDSDQLQQLVIGGNIPTSRVTLKGLSQSDINKIDFSGGNNLLGWMTDPNKAFSDKGGVGLVPTGDGQGEAIGLLKDISKSILSGKKEDWDNVLKTINDWDGNHGNDRVRKLMSALWYAAGGKFDDPKAGLNSDDKAAAAKFKQLLQLLPPEVRTALKNKVTQDQGELDEKDGSDVFNSQDAAAQLDL